MKPAYLEVVPDATLVFFGPFSVPKLTSLRLRNGTDSRIAFKLKTDVPLLYRVWPKTGFVDPGTQILVEICLRAFDERCLCEMPLEHYFAILAHPVAFDYAAPEDFWRENVLKPERVQRHKLPVIIQPLRLKGNKFSLRRCCNRSQRVDSTSQLFYAPSLGESPEGLPPSLPADWEALHHADQIFISSRYSDQAQRIHSEQQRGRPVVSLPPPPPLPYVETEVGASPRAASSPTYHNFDAHDASFDEMEAADQAVPEPTPRAREFREWLRQKSASLLMIREEPVDVAPASRAEDPPPSWLVRTMESTHSRNSSRGVGRPKSEPSLLSTTQSSEDLVDSSAPLRVSVAGRQGRVPLSPIRGGAISPFQPRERFQHQLSASTGSLADKPRPPASERPRPVPMPRSLERAAVARDDLLERKEEWSEEWKVRTLPSRSPPKRRVFINRDDSPSLSSFDDAGVRCSLRQRVSYLDEVRTRGVTGSRLRPLQFRDYQNVMWETARWEATRNAIGSSRPISPLVTASLPASGRHSPIPAPTRIYSSLASPRIRAPTSPTAQSQVDNSTAEE